MTSRKRPTSTATTTDHGAQIITTGVPAKARNVTPGGEASPSTRKTSPSPTTSVTEVPARSLNSIARDIHKYVGKGHDALFAVGRLLLEARTVITSDREFGQWVSDQHIGMSQTTVHRLMVAAAREDEVRAFIAESSATGRDIGPVTAVALLKAGPKAEPKAKPDSDDDQPAPVTSKSGANWFEPWRDLTLQADLQALDVEQLTEFATVLKGAVSAYQTERNRRAE